MLTLLIHSQTEKHKQDFLVNQNITISVLDF